MTSDVLKKWEVKLNRIRELQIATVENVYERSMLIRDVWNDADAHEFYRSQGKFLGDILNDCVQDLGVENFQQLLAILEAIPTRNEWIELRSFHRVLATWMEMENERERQDRAAKRAATVAVEANAGDSEGGAETGKKKREVVHKSEHYRVLREKEDLAEKAKAKADEAEQERQRREDAEVRERQAKQREERAELEVERLRRENESLRERLAAANAKIESLKTENARLRLALQAEPATA